MASPSKSHATHFFSNKGPQLSHDESGCYVCHADGHQQCVGQPLFADLLPLSLTDVCDNCHSPDGAYDGVDDPQLGAKANWDNGVYERDGTTIQSGKEKWCAGCHDDEAANSKADSTGVSAPNVVGNNDTYGFYVTGHKINCLSCHNANKNHIDHEHRTYASWLNNYQAGYRLKSSVTGGEPMIIPRLIYLDCDPIENWQYFALCFECHNRNEVLGDDFYDVDHTNFWHNNDDMGGIWNAHDLHLQFTSLNYDSDWDGTADSMESCVTCHNVHGSTTHVMIRHGELISTYGTTDKVPALDFQYIGCSSLACSVAGKMNMAARQFIAENGVCDSCHGAYPYYRTPYLHVDVLSPEAAPDMVSNDGTGASTITVHVIYHGTDTLNVSIDLSSIGGGSQPMTDEGDGLYSYDAVIPVDTSEGAYAFDITADAGDTSDTGNASAILEVIDYRAIYLNDTDATFSGIWGNNTGGPKYYLGDVHYTVAGDGDTATYTPDIPAPGGNYEVYAWWPEHSNRADDVPYIINYDGGSATFYVNQQVPGTQWIQLGTGSYFFAEGTTGSVVISDDDDAGYVIADGIKLLPE
jgi:hypothetical protein